MYGKVVIDAVVLSSPKKNNLGKFNYIFYIFALSSSDTSNDQS